MKKISVVTVTYNNKDQINNYVNSLKQALSNLDGEVWLIDNNSSDGTDKLISQLKSFNVIVNKENLGFGKANNQALKKIKSEYILLLNPDTVVPRGTIDKLIKYLENHTTVGLVTCRVEKENGKLDQACRRGFPTPWRSICRMFYLDRIFPQSKIFGGYNLTYLPENRINEIDSAVGAFMLIRKEVLDMVGLFDEEFFMYGEDIDLCYRIKAAGWKIVYNPTVKVIHHKGVSSGILSHSAKLSKSNKKHRASMIRHFHNAMHIFYYKHYQDKYPYLLNKIVMIGINIKMYMALARLFIKGY